MTSVRMCEQVPASWRAPDNIPSLVTDAPELPTAHTFRHQLMLTSSFADNSHLATLGNNATLNTVNTLATCRYHPSPMCPIFGCYSTRTIVSRREVMEEACERLSLSVCVFVRIHFSHSSPPLPLSKTSPNSPLRTLTFHHKTGTTDDADAAREGVG